MITAAGRGRCRDYPTSSVVRARPHDGRPRYFRGDRTLGSSFELPASHERNGMSALPSPAPDDVAPIPRAVHTGPIGGRATVVPLIHDAGGPVRLLDGRTREATEPLVLRRALFERLAGARAVTVVSAPAASGKTCLLRSWIVEARLEAHAGWTTVRPGERDAAVLGRARRAHGVAAARSCGSARLPALGGELIVERLLSALQTLTSRACSSSTICTSSNRPTALRSSSAS